MSHHCIEGDALLGLSETDYLVGILTGEEPFGIIINSKMTRAIDVNRTTNVAIGASKPRRGFVRIHSKHACEKTLGNFVNVADAFPPSNAQEYAAEHRCQAKRYGPRDEDLPRRSQPRIHEAAGRQFLP